MKRLRHISVFFLQSITIEQFLLDASSDNAISMRIAGVLRSKKINI